MLNYAARILRQLSFIEVYRYSEDQAYSLIQPIPGTHTAKDPPKTYSRNSKRFHYHIRLISVQSFIFSLGFARSLSLLPFLNRESISPQH